MSSDFKFYLRGEEQTASFGEQLWQLFAPLMTKQQLLVYLYGNLGAGKSFLVRNLIHSSGYRGNVPSPTYSILESYPVATGAIHHLDLYRCGSYDELEMLGVFDFLQAGNLLLIEWPQLLAKQYSADIEVAIEPVGPEHLDRQVVLTVGSPLQQEQDFLKSLTDLTSTFAQ